MPTRQQLNNLWASGWRDDDRIGRGGFEAPNGRQWWEPERNQPPQKFTGKKLGVILYGLFPGQEIYIPEGINYNTDSDDQDWQDFARNR